MTTTATNSQGAKKFLLVAMLFTCMTSKSSDVNKKEENDNTGKAGSNTSTVTPPSTLSSEEEIIQKGQAILEKHNYILNIRLTDHRQDKIEEKLEKIEHLLAFAQEALVLVNQLHDNPNTLSNLATYWNEKIINKDVKKACATNLTSELPFLITELTKNKAKYTKENNFRIKNPQYPINQLIDMYYHDLKNLDKKDIKLVQIEASLQYASNMQMYLSPSDHLGEYSYSPFPKNWFNNMTNEDVNNPYFEKIKTAFMSEKPLEAFTNLCAELEIEKITIEKDLGIPSSEQTFYFAAPSSLNPLSRLPLTDAFKATIPSTLSSSSRSALHPTPAPVQEQQRSTLSTSSSSSTSANTSIGKTTKNSSVTNSPVRPTQQKKVTFQDSTASSAPRSIHENHNPAPKNNPAQSAATPNYHLPTIGLALASGAHATAAHYSSHYQTFLEEWTESPLQKIINLIYRGRDVVAGPLTRSAWYTNLMHCAPNITEIVATLAVGSFAYTALNKAENAYAENTKTQRLIGAIKNSTPWWTITTCGLLATPKEFRNSATIASLVIGGTKFGYEFGTSQAPKNAALAIE